MAEVNEVNVSRGGRMAEAQAAAKGGKLKLMLIAVLLLIVLGGGAAGGLWFFLGHGKNEDMARAGGDRAAGGGGHGGIEGCPTENLNYITLGDFVVNLADGRRYLKTKIDLMLCDKKVAAVNAYLAARMAEIKDLVISELQTLSSEQLRDQKERELLRQRLLRRVESLLPNTEHDWEDPNPIKKVLITEFYLQ
jgi:flagellar FliL protein